MTQEYKITGMTCNSCVARVQKSLQSIPGVSDARVTLSPPLATVESKMEISVQTFRNALAMAGNYDAISIKERQNTTENPEEAKQETFKPLIIIGLYLVLAASLASYPVFSLHHWMRIFMAGFFLTFSLFKMLDIRSFATTYKMYDIPAKYIPGYAYIYPFLELALGVLYMLDISPRFTNTSTLLIMGVSIIGVIRSVLDKKKIRCACLGSVFNLPMTTVTIIEDALMIGMAAVMLVNPAL